MSSTEKGNTIRWGILGAAGIAKSQVGPAIMKSRNGRVAAVASRGLEKAQAFVEDFPGAKAFGSYEEMLDSGEIDAVYNPLPNSEHKRWSLACLERKLPVLVEKPMAVNADEAEEMVRAFEDQSVQLAEAFMFRFHPLTRTAHDIVHSGQLGEIVLVRSQFTTDLRDLNDIRLNRGLGGGAMRDLGCYCISVIRHLLDQDPDRIHAYGRWGSESHVDETVVGILGFPSRVLAHFSCSFGSLFTCAYEVIGTRGRLLVDQGAMVAWPGGEFEIKLQTPDGEEVKKVPPANHYQLMVEDFADALLFGRPTRFSPRDSIANLRVLDAVLASASESMTM